MVRGFVILAISLIFYGAIPLISVSAEFAPPSSDTFLLRDAAVDEDGNIYLIAVNWASERPQLKSYTPDGKDRGDFRVVLPNFCCEPFPLKLVYGQDGFIYVLLPTVRSSSIKGSDLQLARLDKTGRQDEKFGDGGLLVFPSGFLLKDFDVSPTGSIWVLNDALEIYKFDETGVLRKIRDLRDIFPKRIMGERFESYYGRNLFAIEDQKLLLFGELSISSTQNPSDRYFSVFELDNQGILLKHQEWQFPWFRKSSEYGSFFGPLRSKSIIRDVNDVGSVLGFPEGVQDTPDARKLVVIDWTSKDGFSFYNLIQLQLPKEVYLDYDLNQVFFVRNSRQTTLFFPIDIKREVLAVNYDKDGKIISKFNLKAYD